ncbi:actin [Balamuthia mandrillaris]
MPMESMACSRYVGYPIQRGIIEDWDDFERLLVHCLYEQLRYAPVDRAFFMMLSPLNPQKKVEKLCELLLESYDVPAVGFRSPHMMAPLSVGRPTGLFVDCGAGRTTVTPLYENYVLEHAIRQVDLGGVDVCGYLQRLLAGATGRRFTTSSELLLLESIQQKMCYVSTTRPSQPGNDVTPPSWTGDDLSSCKQQTFELPDGTLLDIGDALRQSTEVMFNPSLMGREPETCPALPSLILQSVNACPIDCRKDLLQNIHIVGGNCQYPGLLDRLHTDLAHLLSPSSHLLPRLSSFASASPPSYLHQLPHELLSAISSKVSHHQRKRIQAAIQHPSPELASWRGGSVLAGRSFRELRHLYLTKEEYEEHGCASLDKVKNWRHRIC